MGTKAAIFIQRGAPEEKQQRVCLAYVEEMRWSMLDLIPHWAPEDAVTLVRRGVVDVIVTAFDSKAAHLMAAEIAPTGRVVYVHPEPTEIHSPAHRPRTIVDLILRWRRRGRTVEEIAEEIDGETKDVRDILRKAGEDLA
jgi:hypothetical protein